MILHAVLTLTIVATFGQTAGFPKRFEALTNSVILDVFGTSIMEAQGSLC